MRKYAATLPPHIWGMAGIVFYALEYFRITIQIITKVEEWERMLPTMDIGQRYISTSFFEVAAGASVMWKLDEIAVTVQIFSLKANRMDTISF